MNDNHPVISAGLLAQSRIGATLALGFFAGLMTWQIIGVPLAALGAALAAAAVCGALWGGFVVRGGGVSLGRAAGLGALVTIAAYLGAAILGGGVMRVLTEEESAVAALFSLWVVMPVMIAVALSLAVLTRAKAGR